MGYARAHLGQGLPVAFAHRYITRPAESGGENHVFLTDEEFLLRQTRGLFCLCWQSHGLRYGLGREIEAWMGAGLRVVVNGSRAYYPEAAAKYPGLTGVEITADPDHSVQTDDGLRTAGEMQVRGAQLLHHAEKSVYLGHEGSACAVRASGGPLKRLMVSAVQTRVRKARETAVRNAWA